MFQYNGKIQVQWLWYCIKYLIIQERVTTTSIILRLASNFWVRLTHWLRDHWEIRNSPSNLEICDNLLSSLILSSNTCRLSSRIRIHRERKVRNIPRVRINNWNWNTTGVTHTTTTSEPHRKLLLRGHRRAHSWASCRLLNNIFAATASGASW